MKMRMLSQVGAGEVTGNPLFQAFDEAIRGCALGETAVLEAKGGNWMPDLYFEVCLSILEGHINRTVECRATRVHMYACPHVEV